MFSRLIRNIPTKGIQNTTKQPISKSNPSIFISLHPVNRVHTNRNEQSLSTKIAMFTGNVQMLSQNDRVMKRIWEKRQKRLTNATNKFLAKFQKENFKIKCVELYVRGAGSFDDTQDNTQRDVHISLRGIAHTSVVLIAENQLAFLLDRVVEGIRLTELKIDDTTQKIAECHGFKPHEMVKINSYENIDLTSTQIAEFIHQESQRPYHVLMNSCVQFAIYFHQQFLIARKMRQAYKLLKEKQIIYRM